MSAPTTGLDDRSQLVIEVRLHDARFHGLPEWPPAPARLFQALVAASAAHPGDAAFKNEAFAWLEALSPPVIGAPRAVRGRERTAYVPNNDLDAVGGDPGRIGEVRVGKSEQPMLLDPDTSFIYAWSLPEDSASRRFADLFVGIATHLYQFGRGTDMAWATADVVGKAELEQRLLAYCGEVIRPSGGPSALLLACPRPGSFRRLAERFDAYRERFSEEGKGRKRSVTFTQPPMVSFRDVSYGGEGSIALFQLERTSRTGAYAAWPQVRAHELVVQLRDRALGCLKRAFPDRGPALERFVMGRRPDDAPSGDSESRVRIIPLPSIGHRHVDPSIRRFVVIVPEDGPIASDDVIWAFGRVDLEDGAVSVVRADDVTMLDHYGAGGGATTSRTWRSVTPVVLPVSAGRRRIDPARVATESKGARERNEEEGRARAALGNALRHAGVRRNLLVARVRREPFDAKGCHAEKFTRPSRFESRRLWHVELELDAPVHGPLILGDGRFVGLGVMRPVDSGTKAIVFEIESGPEAGIDPVPAADAFRRAVLSRVQSRLGRGRSVPSSITGHSADGTPMRRGARVHLAFDPPRGRFLVVCGREGHPAARRRTFDLLREALSGMTWLRIGRVGQLELRPASVSPTGDPVFGEGLLWRSVTPYVVHRHRVGVDASHALRMDVARGCRGAGLPDPFSVEVHDVRGVPGIGLCGSVTVRFRAVVSGPLFLGRTRFKGGGLMEVRDTFASGGSRS